MRRIFAQTRKELIQLVRDWRTFALALVLPLVLLVLMSTAISLTVSHLPIVVQDLDGSPVSRDLINSFRASITFHVVTWATDKQPELAFTSNMAHAALIIPEHFGRDIARGVDSPLQLLIDASDANTAKLIAGYAGQITRAYDRLNAGPSRVEPVQALVAEVFRSGNFRSRAVPFSTAARVAGYGKRGRTEDDPASVRLQHPGA
jgi:ABC-2 type transport system permease protein